MLQIAICDDEITQLNRIQQITQACYQTNQIFASIHTFSSSNALLYEIEDSIHYDLLILDIEMPGLNGMELAHQVKKYLPNVLIIFVTSHMEYVLDAYELSIFRYIPKNGSADRLENALLDAAAMIELQARDSYILQSSAKLDRIPLKNLLYITHEGKNACLFTNLTDPDTGNFKEYKVRKSLQQVYDELDPAEFIFIDRGCIINLSQVMSIQGSNCILKDGTRLQISQARVQETKDKLLLFWRNIL